MRDPLLADADKLAVVLLVVVFRPSPKYASHHSQYGSLNLLQELPSVYAHVCGICGLDAVWYGHSPGNGNSTLRSEQCANAYIFLNRV
jgi:hypothetical protein